MRVLAIQSSATLRRNPLVTVSAPAVPTARRRSRRRIAFWAFFSIVAMIAVVAGVLTWQIIDTLGTVNSASTPPPVISGSVLGGSPEVEIDTSHARTAVAISELDLTATPVPTATSTIAPTSTASPTATATITNVIAVDPSIPAPAATETAVSEADEDYDLPTEIDVPVDNLTATPQPEPTAPTAEATVLSEIERIENGSFEDGVTTWYLESGAGPVLVDDAPDGTTMLQIPAIGAYADQGIFTIPGTSYYLSGTGRMTAEGDSGVIGVVYQDAQQNRLPDLEPAPITFTSTKLARKGMTFTPPAEVVNVKIYASRMTVRLLCRSTRSRCGALFRPTSKGVQSTARHD